MEAKKVIKSLCLFIGFPVAMAGAVLLSGHIRASSIPDHQPGVKIISNKNLGEIVLEDIDKDYSVDGIRKAYTTQFLYLKEEFMDQYGSSNTKVLEAPHQHSFDEIYKNMNLLERRDFGK